MGPGERLLDGEELAREAWEACLVGMVAAAGVDNAAGVVDDEVAMVRIAQAGTVVVLGGGDAAPALYVAVADTAQERTRPAPRGPIPRQGGAAFPAGPSGIPEGLAGPGERDTCPEAFPLGGASSSCLLEGTCPAGLTSAWAGNPPCRTRHRLLLAAVGNWASVRTYHWVPEDLPFREESLLPYPSLGPCRAASPAFLHR